MRAPRPRHGTLVGIRPKQKRTLSTGHGAAPAQGHLCPQARTTLAALERRAAGPLHASLKDAEAAASKVRGVPRAIVNEPSAQAH